MLTLSSPSGVLCSPAIAVSASLRMPAAFDSHAHLHTGDCWGVAISGVATNGKPGTADVPLPTGSYGFRKGGELHVTKCLSPDECLLFISQGGKFDAVVKAAQWAPRP